MIGGDLIFDSQREMKERERKVGMCQKVGAKYAKSKHMGCSFLSIYTVGIIEMTQITANEQSLTSSHPIYGALQLAAFIKGIQINRPVM